MSTGKRFDVYPRCARRGWHEVRGYNPQPGRPAHACRYCHLWRYDDERKRTMRFAVARPYDRDTPGYSAPDTKAHAAEVLPSGHLAEHTMCRLDGAGLRLETSGYHRCARCERAVTRRTVDGDELESLV